MNQDALSKSIVLTGPVGNGAPLFAQELSKKTGYPVISFEIFKELPPKSYLDTMFAFSSETRESELYKLRRKFFQSEYIPLDEVEERLKNLRNLLPNVENFRQMNYNYYVPDFLAIYYSPIGRHYYQKQYENRLLKQIIENLSVPVILDISGGTAICLEENYKTIESHIVLEHRKQLDRFRAHLPNGIKFSETKELLSCFSNVINLQLPQNYSHIEKAKNEAVNPAFIRSHQYEETATQNVSVEDCFDKKGKTVWKNIFRKADQIIDRCTNVTPFIPSQDELTSSLSKLDSLLDGGKKDSTAKNKDGK